MKYTVVQLAAVFLAMFCAGCGGGTSGTGDPAPRVVVIGTVFNQNGSPVSSGTVAAVENGDSAQISVDGRFTLDTTAETEVLELDVSTDVAQGRITLQGLGNTDSEVSITIVVDQGTGSVTLSDFDISVSGNPGVTQNQDPQLRIVGSVEAEDKTGVPGIVVEFVSTHDQDTTDTRGYFQFDPVKAQSSIELIVNSPGDDHHIRVRIDGLSTSRSSTANIRLRLLGLQNGSVFPNDGFVDVEVAAVSVSP